MAWEGPGKSSGTIGLPLTRERSGGGVVPSEDSVPTLISTTGSSPKRVASVDGRLGRTRRTRVPEGVASLLCSSSKGGRFLNRFGALEAVKSTSGWVSSGCLGNVIGTRLRGDSGSECRSGSDKICGAVDAVEGKVVIGGRGEAVEGNPKV